MLDPPISQADIDAGTVFVRRDGSEVRIVEHFNDDISDHHWRACDKYYYCDDGSFFTSRDKQQFDLIARKPKESEMSQVVVEDLRSRVPEEVRFADAELETIYSWGGGVYLKISGCHGMRIEKRDPPRFGATIFDNGTLICPRPDLRLRLVLETI